MIAWLSGTVPYLKALHIIFLVIWCAGLFALPMMLARHNPTISQAEYSRIRLASHYGYTWIVTPAALVAIAAGTLLIFLREVFVVWMFAKLFFVAALIGFHAWVGGTIVSVAEGNHQTPAPLAPLLLLLAPLLAILILVLAKPELEEIPLPDWLMAPRGHQLPFGVPPRL